MAIDLSWEIDAGLELWPDADRATVERIAARAQQIAEDTERQGIEEGWSYGACQTSYGCDWKWKTLVDGTAGEDEPTARVYDCDGESIATVTPADVATWCVCGRESEDDAWEPLEIGLESEGQARAWLRENHRQHNCAAFYVDREENEGVAESYFDRNDDGSLTEYQGAGKVYFAD